MELLPLKGVQYVTIGFETKTPEIMSYFGPNILFFLAARWENKLKTDEAGEHESGAEDVNRLRKLLDDVAPHQSDRLRQYGH
jgi:hypothetical protein